MKTQVTHTELAGLVLLDIDYAKDERGFFMESWNKKTFADAGLTDDFVQDSHSASTYGVLRGLHYQDMRAPMTKLVRCTVGKIWDIAVDLRADSPTFGKWLGVELSAENKKLIYVPVGFAHGFVTLSDYCEVQYKQTGYYNQAAEGGIAWNDPDIGIEWPILEPILSKRDQRQSTFQQYRREPSFR